MLEKNNNIDFANSNTLKYSTSPYLLEHAENPVHWHEWNDETLALAKELDKQLIISVGYAACHWCHVMANQSFSDAGVAEIMNTHFICIKIDREERPDLDQIYMNAAQIINGNGGWPLNAFAFPDGRPFFAATYFPKNRWIQLLTQIRNLYQMDRQKLEDQADNITQSIRGYEVITLPGEDIDFTKEDFENSFNQWFQYADREKGGTKGAPKFPLPTGWDYLLDFYYFTKNNDALKMVTTTLDAMAAGGIYDQIGGGFARYSVDENWLVPHFEKMLYDNAQLISLYSNAYKTTKNEIYKQVVAQTIDFLKRELLHSEGGFYSSLNADSENVEGKYYVWTQNEIIEILGEKEGRIICGFYNISEEGNWEDGVNILHYKSSFQDFAKQNNISIEDFKLLKERADLKLLEKRESRIRPETDTKVLTAWNGLMIKGLVDAYSAFGNKEYLDLAKNTADFLWMKMKNSNGSLMRNYSAGKVSVDGFLDDYAYFADALILLYQSSFDIKYLNYAKYFIDYAIEHFKSKNGIMFYYTSDNSKSLVARKMEIADNVISSSNSVIANVLYRIGVLLEDLKYIDISIKMLSLVKDKISEGGPYYANWAKLMALLSHSRKEVVITGKGFEKALFEIQKYHFPNLIFAGGIAEDMPLLKGRIDTEKLQIFVCTNNTCGLPLYSVEEAIKQLDE